MAKKEKLDFLDKLTAGLVQVQVKNAEMTVIEFIENVCDAFTGTDKATRLFPQQRAILKAIYNLPMESGRWGDIFAVKEDLEASGYDADDIWDEEEILRNWTAEGKCNWRPNAEVLIEANAERAAHNANLQRGQKKKAMLPHFNYQNVTLQMGMRTGKTLANSLIKTESGYKYFSELFETQQLGEAKKMFDASFEVLSRHGWKHVHTGFTKPPERCINLRGRYGYEIGGAATHPLLVMTTSGRLEWKLMPDIQKGDYLCIGRKPFEDGVQSKPLMFQGREIDRVKLGRFLGLVVGDGCSSESNKFSISFTSDDLELIQEFQNLAADLFGAEARVEDKQNTTAKAVVLRGFSEARAWLLTQGLGYETAYGKKVPHVVRTSGRPAVKAFLSGLFDTDGWAETGSTLVGFASASEQLVREVQILLLDFGIVSSRKFKTSKYTKQDGSLATHWSMSLDGPEAIRFGQTIGFGLVRKQAVVNTYTLKPNYGSTVDKIPFLVDRLRAAKELEGHSPKGSGRREKWAKIRRQCAGTLRKVHKDKPSGITYRLLPDVIDYYAGISGAEDLVTDLRELQDQNLFFDEIVEIWEDEQPMYDLGVAEVEEYLANGIVSHNSSTVGLIVAYEFFRLITMENPQRYLGVADSSSIYLTVLASTEKQTQGTIFGYVKSYVEKSTFFKSFIESNRLIVRELDIEFPEKNIKIASGHSRATSIVGRSAVVVAFDELAMFSADDGHTSNAKDIYSRVGRSAATFRDKSRRIAMSSVKAEGDFMQELVEKNWNRQVDGHLIFNLATFDGNPLMTMDNPVIKDDYTADFVTAQRDYENIRPSSASAFLNPVVVDRATEGRLDPTRMEGAEAPGVKKEAAVYRQIDSPRFYYDEKLKRNIPFSAIEAIIEPADWGMESVGHVDPAIRKDSMAFACGHGEMSERGIITVIDICLEWIPRPLGQNRMATIDYIDVEEKLIEVARKRNLVKLTFDHFQQEATVQRLLRENITAHTLTFSAGLQMKMYELLRARLNAGLIRIPKHPTLVEELKNLELQVSPSQQMGRISHPKSKDSVIPGRGKISKDLADCVAAVNWHIAQDEREFVRDAGWNPSLGQAGGNGITHQGFNSMAVGKSGANTNINWGFQ